VLTLSRPHIVFFIVSLLAISFLAYQPSLDNEFTNWDDPKHLTQSPLVKSLSVENIQRIFQTSVNGTYIPLTIFSFTVEYHFFKYNPFVYHLDNLVLHMGVVILIFVLAIRLGMTGWAAWAVALLFALHPMHVESVAWVTERKDVLYAFFYLSSILVYFNYLKNKKWLAYVGALLFAFLSILTKPMALSLPLILFLFDWYQQRKNLKRILIEKIPFFLIIVPIAWLTYRLHTRNPIQDGMEAVMIWVWTLTFYLREFFFPVRLNPQYDLPQPVGLSNFEYVFSVALFVLVLLLLFYFRKNRQLVFAFLFYFLSIFFLLRFDTGKDQSIVADRFMYLPSLGFCFLLGYGIDRLKGYSEVIKKIAYAVIIFVLVLFFRQTYIQNDVWQDSVTLWSTVLKKGTHLGTVYTNRGEAYAKKEQYDLAFADFNKAIDLDPLHYSAYNNRAFIYSIYGKPQQALEDFSRAIQIKPIFESYYNRATIYQTLGENNSAILDYTKSIELNSHYSESFLNRGLMYLKTGDYHSALKDFDEAMKINPRYVQAYNNRAYVLNFLGKYEEAIESCNQSIELNDLEAPCYYIRGNAYKAQGEYQKAVLDYTQAIERNPRFTHAYLNRAKSYEALQFFSEAFNDLKMAQSLGQAEVALDLKRIQKILENN
jgi:tetratricopeptide (TPR) repeat protein